MKTRLSILGSTGSIGSTTLKIVSNKKNFFSIFLLSSNKNYKVICKQIKQFKPKVFVISDRKTFLKIKKKFKNSKTKFLNNFSRKEILNCDVTVSSIPGILGIHPTLIMVEKSKNILIANKESVICAWDIIKKKATKNNTKITPIDSEHFSILKLLEKQKIKNLDQIYLTASGGPFLNYKINQLKNVSVEKALNHPKWKMGKKISIDSATLMNKMFELIEAQKLFNLPQNKLDIVIHPNSLVHAIVKLKNGLVYFIYHETTMIIPIANALLGESVDIRNFFQKKNSYFKPPIENLEFNKVDPKKFPVYKLKDRINEYNSTPIILNSTNETLIDLFLKKKIKYTDISKTIFDIMNDRNYRKYAIRKSNNLKKILNIVSWAKETTMKILKKNV